MSLDSFYTTIAQVAETLPDITIDQYDKISNGCFRILAFHPDVPRKMTVKEYIGQVEATLKDNFEVVAESIQPLNVKDIYSRQFVSMIVQARKIVEDYNPEEVSKKFKSVTANVFADNEDVLWKVVEADGKKLLVQTQNEDFEGILRNRMGDRPAATIASFSFGGIVPSNGDFTMYYDPDTFKTEAGIAAHVDGQIVVAPIENKGSSWKAIRPAQVIETVLASSIDDEHSALKGIKEIVAKAGGEPTTDEFSSAMGRALLTYYADLYGGSDFYKALMNGVAERREFGNEDRPLIQTRY